MESHDYFFSQNTDSSLILPDQIIENGYGEFVLYHLDQNGEKKPLNQREYALAYKILLNHSPGFISPDLYRHRHIEILNHLKSEIGPDCEVAFMPRVFIGVRVQPHCPEIPIFISRREFRKGSLL